VADPLLKRLRDVAGIVTVIALSGFVVYGSEQATATEIKAAYLYNFTKFIQWPQGDRAPRLAVALSAYASPPDRERAIADGFNHHIAKPIDPDLLVQAVHRMLTGQPAAAS